MDPEAIGLKVGLEIHQQLATRNKLFCNCKPIEVEEHEHEFFRRLRPTQSELGEYDPAAIFEFKKGRMIRYLASNFNSCLVEADEEPPHDLNQEALETALILSLALSADIVDEVHVMRKIVIDGSNTTGFQRTMLIAIGGEIDGVKIQTISLEEDAARIIDENEKIKSYALDRLGVPLIEISLAPVTKRPEEIADLALKLGRLLRASKRVARGLGTIRQDVNISIKGGNVIEVKGVQKLDQLKHVIEYEMKRQHGLLIIANKLKERIDSINYKVADVSNIFKNSRSKVIKKALVNGVVKAIKVDNISGMLGFEPYEGIRLGRELGELVRFYGLGGIFHSDELPAYGITEEDLVNVKEVLDARDEDGIIILAGNEENVNYSIDAIIDRLNEALKGVPAETRAATSDGKTVYSRPRPGAARMYPETDIPPVVISKDMLNTLKKDIPKQWDEYIDELSKKYNINKVLAEKVFDSEYLNLFEDIAEVCKNVPNTLIASTLTETIVSLEREGYDTRTLNDEILVDIFRRLDRGEIAKEVIDKILETIMSKKVSVDEAIKLLDIKKVDEEEVEKIIDNIINDNISIIKEKGEHAFSMLMGKAMSQLRGKVDGKKVSMIIKQKISEYK
ncbi:MAG: Glu-tRNA(Gln) amidotransferase GatDE subunit E [Candidatus Nitrosothermus koennekii]|nr:MAG: Glu-tRNA(Gln) amidotransferase GatDE subunit E [Candidatus Nitrosothermus koennekii]